MVRSWAGAMGQPQFMPSSYVNYAADFSGDGHPDIWTNVPDALASTANYLQEFKWKHGVPWGFEVMVPNSFDTMHSRASFAEWQKLGVRRADGKPFPRDGQGDHVLSRRRQRPSLHRHAEFRCAEGLQQLRRLCDRGRASCRPDEWRGSRSRRRGRLTIARCRAMRALPLQKRLAALGYKVNEFDGHVDFDLRDNIRAELGPSTAWCRTETPRRHSLKRSA